MVEFLGWIQEKRFCPCNTLLWVCPQDQSNWCNISPVGVEYDTTIREYSHNITAQWEPWQVILRAGCRVIPSRDTLSYQLTKFCKQQLKTSAPSGHQRYSCLSPSTWILLEWWESSFRKNNFVSRVLKDTCYTQKNKWHQNGALGALFWCHFSKVPFC